MEKLNKGEKIGIAAEVVGIVGGLAVGCMADLAFFNAIPMPNKEIGKILYKVGCGLSGYAIGQMAMDKITDDVAWTLVTIDGIVETVKEKKQELKNKKNLEEVVA